jgi:hypothetical protein
MMGGMGMGGMGMGGMGGGMGGMGGMGGGMRSVPPTGPLETTLKAGQRRDLPTPVVSMNAPNRSMQPTAPSEGETLQISGIDQFTDDRRTQEALKRLAEAKAPQTISQMVFWYVTAGASWNDVGRLSQGWGNASELALAKQFVANLGDGEEPASPGQGDAGVIFWDIKAKAPVQQKLVDGLREIWSKTSVLGLTATEGVPLIPSGPALACQAVISDSGVDVRLQASHPSGTDWTLLDHFKVDLPASATDPKAAALLGDAVAGGMVERLVNVKLTRGPAGKGKESFQIKIVNESPLILNGLALGGSEIRPDNPPAMLQGLSVPPRKGLSVPASQEVVSRLHLKDGLKVYAADLSGL